MNWTNAMQFETFESLLSVGSLLLQATFVILVCGILVTLLRKQSAALSHRIWFLGFLSLLILPTALWIGIPFQISVFENSAPIAASQNSVNIESVQRITTTETVSAIATNNAGSGVSNDISTSQPSQSDGGNESTSPTLNYSKSFLANISVADWLPKSLFGWLMTVWITGSGLLLIRLLMAAGCLRNAVAESQNVEGKIGLIGGEIAAKMNLDPNRFQIRISKNNRMPVAFWWRGWNVVLPKQADRWDDQQLRSVVAHELGHVARRDAVADLFGQLVLVAYWFHPLVWLALPNSKRIREKACDDLVIEQAQLSPADYARSLLKVVADCSFASNGESRLASAIASPNSVEERIRRILDKSTRKAPSSLFACSVIFIALISMLASPMVRLVLAQNLVAADVNEDMLVSASGRVLAADGKPYKNAEVVLRNVPALFDTNAGINRYRDQMAKVKTDANGKFNIPATLIPGRFHRSARQQRNRYRFELLVYTSDHGLTHAALTENNTSDVKITLKPRASLEGIVVDSDGKPLENALIEAITIVDANAERDHLAQSVEYSNFIYSSLAPTTTSDSNGRFRLEGLPSNARLDCWVHHRAHPFQHFCAVTGKDKKPAPIESLEKEIKVWSGPVRVEMKPGYQAQATVVDHKGDPVEATIRMTGGAIDHRLINFDSNLKNKYSVAVKQEGHFAMWTRAAGSNMMVRKSLKLTEFNLERAEQVLVELPKSKKVKGRVADDLDQPVSGMQVQWASKEGDKSVSSSATTDTKGVFEIEVIIGKGELSFVDQAFNTAENVFVPTWRQTRGEDAYPSWPVEVAADTEEFIEAMILGRGLMISGVVRDSDGSPIGNASVKAVKSSFEDRLQPSQGFATSDEEGKYEIRGLNPRCGYEITINGDTQSTIVRTENFAKHPIDKTKLLKLDLTTKQTVALVGRVLLDGKPVVDMPISVKANRHTTETKTDVEGRYKLYGVLPGDQYMVEITPSIPAIAPGWEHQSPHVQTLAMDVGRELELKDMNLVRMTQTVSGRIVDPEGNPVEGATISADMADGRMLARFKEYPVPWATSDAEGKFKITHLPAEKVKLLAYIPPTGDDNTIRNSVSIEPKLNETDIEIELNPNWQE